VLDFRTKGLGLETGFILYRFFFACLSLPLQWTFSLELMLDGDVKYSSIIEGNLIQSLSELWTFHPSQGMIIMNCKNVWAIAHLELSCYWLMRDEKKKDSAQLSLDKFFRKVRDYMTFHDSPNECVEVRVRSRRTRVPTVTQVSKKWRATCLTGHPRFLAASVT
jgi:2-polyprenyl-6-methoxyphenol hydroxylase-like FAD-dependent oxidoreductase